METTWLQPNPRLARNKAVTSWKLRVVSGYCRQLVNNLRLTCDEMGTWHAGRKREREGKRERERDKKALDQDSQHFNI